ncbi:MAG: endonuclease/exonuclease/phosphatase family protein [Phycisphaerae bacterium]|jgi:endonuclease/exonuclease/phosphatase family metal-dependent hydrolase
MTDQHSVDEAIETRLRVLTWNIWWRFGPWERRRPAISATLADLDADVIALQEVWSDETTNLAAELAGELGYHHLFESGMELKGFGFGNALLSRWQITRQDSTILYGQKETGEGRLALFAEIDGPRGLVPVFSTHLTWRFNHSHIRQRQVADLARFVDRMRPWTFPPILCGDFNAEPSSEEIRMLKGLTTCPVEGLAFHDAWAVAGGGGPGLTWDNNNPYAVAEFEPDRRIDYIFLGRPEAHGAGQVVDCRVTGNEAVDGVWPSDHHAVLAEIRY